MKWYFLWFKQYNSDCIRIFVFMFYFSKIAVQNVSMHASCPSVYEYSLTQYSWHFLTTLKTMIRDMAEEIELIKHHILEDKNAFPSPSFLQIQVKHLLTFQYY